MKRGKIIISLFLTFLIIISFASARDTSLGDNLEHGGNQLVDIVTGFITPFLTAFFGGEGELLFQKLLFFILIISLVYVVLSKNPLFDEYPNIIWIVASVVALLSTRFLTELEFVNAILLPYSVLGVAITSAIPLIIFFTFVQKFESAIARKVLWIFFIIIFFGLGYKRYPEIGNLVWIYLITGVLSLIFFFADGTIRRFMIKQQYKELGMDSRDEFERKIRNDIRNADNDLHHNIITTPQHKKIIKRLQKKLKALYKH